MKNNVLFLTFWELITSSSLSLLNLKVCCFVELSRYFSFSTEDMHLVSCLSILLLFYEPEIVDTIPLSYEVDLLYACKLILIDSEAVWSYNNPFDLVLISLCLSSLWFSRLSAESVELLCWKLVLISVHFRDNNYPY